MKKTWSRRQFFKAAGASGAAYGVASVLDWTGLAALAKPSIPERVAQTLKQVESAPTLPSTLLFGKPLADISKGWDGTLWGIDTAGVPYHFDQLSQTWNVFGTGFDVIAHYDATSFFVVRGAEVSTAHINGGAPQALSSLWHNLPDSFAQGLDGAANIQGVLYLFRNGRYVTIDKATNTASDPVELTSISGWPTTANWQHGVIDAVGSNGTTITDTRVLLWSKGEFIFVDMLQKKVIDGPHPLTYYVKGQMLAAMQQGFTTMLWDETDYEVQVFNGPVAWVSGNRDGTAGIYYPSGYYPDWNPTLAHAPIGRIGALWAARRDGLPYPAYHDGTSWRSGPHIRNQWVAAGEDDTVFALGGSNALYQLNPATNSWTSVATTTSAMTQLAVGNADHIWARDTQNKVYRRNGATFTEVNLGHPATDIAAGSDGTLWHAAGDANIYRFIPEGRLSSSVLLGLTNGAAISKVAGTGFGDAYLLTNDSAQLHEYVSPYVFKTPNAYFTYWVQWQQAPQSMVAAGHSLFMVASNASQTTANTVVALDAQSGDELWKHDLPTNSAGKAQSALLYDPTRQQVYVSTALTVRAFDSNNGTLLWSLNASDHFSSGILIGMALSDGRLCISHESGKLMLIDVDGALVSGQQGSSPQPLWVSPGPQIPSGTLATTVGIPTFDDTGTIYVAIFGTGQVKCQVMAVNPGSGRTLWQKQMSGSPTISNTDVPVWDMIVGETYQHGTTTRVSTLFVNGGDQLYALNPSDGSVINTFVLPHGSTPNLITSAMAYRDDRLYFGDHTGKLYVVNALLLQSITTTKDADPNSSSLYDNWHGVLGRPQLIAGKTASDGLVVAFTRGEQHIWLFDPQSDGGAVASVTTDQTMNCSLSYDDAHGVLYSMGWGYVNNSPSIGQVFAIRPDSFIQDERSFIIESELMQDFANDAEAEGEGASRYHTHVTIVDDVKAPRPYQSVKLWADEADTKVSIDGTPYTIGPDKPALFTTDGSGSFTIISDADDLASVSMRVWAPFMDGSERIAIVPDAQFHNRLSTTTANGSDNPQQIDLKSAQSYDGKPLFDDGNQAQQTATAITQLTGSVGMGKGTATLLSGGVRTHTSTSKYITYSQHLGIAYTPVDVAANQDVDAQTPLGLSITAQGHTELTAAQAANLIDQMEGTPHVLLGGFQNALKSAWQEIKQTAAKIEQVAISVAKDVYVGIKYVVNGVIKVVKAVVQDIKDAAVAIGSFFVQLGKDLLKVVQALSVLLHLDKVIATAKIIHTQINAKFDQLGEVLTRGKGELDGLFEAGEQQIEDSFCKLYTILGLPGCTPQGVSSGSSSVSSYGSIGATPTDVYNTGQPAGQPSQAVQAGWSTHTLRNNVDQATPSNQALLAAEGGSTIVSQFQTFFHNLATDPVLSQSLAQTRKSFSETFKATSAEQFFKMGLQDLLEVFKTVLIAGIAVTKALVDTLLDNIDAVVKELRAMGSVKIPILSALWHKLTGNDLTFLDLLAFVLAFPTTIIYRGLVGAYPQQSTLLGAEGEDKTAVLLGGIVGSLSMMVFSITSAIVDTEAVSELGATEGEPHESEFAPLAAVSSVALLVTKLFTEINEAVVKKSPLTGALAGAGVIEVLLAYAEAKGSGGLAHDAVEMLTNAAAIPLAYGRYVHRLEEGEDTVLNDLFFSTEIVGRFPGVVSPIKVFGPPIGYIAPVVDLACRFGAGAVLMAATFREASLSETTERQYYTYLPVVAR